MILKSIICIFKGHDINPDESIVGDIMIDKRNWLCKCHMCGLYEMHDGWCRHWSEEEGRGRNHDGSRI